MDDYWLIAQVQHHELSHLKDELHSCHHLVQINIKTKWAMADIVFLLSAKDKQMEKKTNMFMKKRTKKNKTKNEDGTKLIGRDRAQIAGRK